MGKRSVTLGGAMEDAAMVFLAKSGYVILERNYRTRMGEIDAVAVQGGTLVFVEVRYRKDSSLVSAESSVNAEKIRRIKTAVRRYLYERNVASDVPVRIDLCVVRDMGRSFDVVADIAGFSQ